MQSIVFFGKGGIGKSTIASNITAILAAKGRKVLHVGCDPKGDSTLSLAGRRLKHFAEGGTFAGESALRACLHPTLLKNVTCIEAGGPQAGVGCAGAGIGAMLDIMNEFSVLERDGYDAAVFDVLGDVVCGGFAAPLRRGLAGKAVIVVSEELLSLYAANKLIAMVNNYARNGVWLAGLAVNAKDRAGVLQAEAFAAAAGTRVLGIIPRDPAVGRAERLRRPVVLREPGSPAAAALVRLAAAIEAAKRPAKPPHQLGDAELHRLFSGASLPAAAGRAAAVRLPPAERIRRAGFALTGFAGGQVVCSWRGFGVLIAPAGEARDGMVRVDDWAFCFSGDRRDESSGLRPELEAAAASLAGVTFDDFVASFGGSVDFYGSVPAFEEIARHSLRDGHAPKEPHVGYGQWHRFLFPSGELASVPPGAVMVEHGDCECRFSSCSRTALSSFQKSSGGLSADHGPGPGPSLPHEADFVFNTGLTYDEAVRGDAGKVAAALDAAAAKAGPGGLVEFYSTCSAMLLATDVKPLLAEAAARRRVGVLRENFNSFFNGTPEKIAARAALVASRVKALGRTKKDFDVNLCGCGSARGALEELLASAGLKAAPAGAEYYRAIASSRLQVLCEPDKVLEEGFKKSGLPCLLPPAPYGPEGSRAWLAALLKALGRGPAPRTAAPAAWAEHAAALKGRGAIFVANGDEIPSLDGGTEVCGVPLLSFLAAAGLKLRLLTRSTPENRAAAAKALAGLPPAVRRAAGLAFFGTREELARALAAEKGARLMYSDIPMDARCVAAGKVPFSISLFEPGFAGAAETLRRLRRLHDWDLNGKKFSAGGL